MSDSMVEKVLEEYEENYKKLDYSQRIFYREKLKNIVRIERSIYAKKKTLFNKKIQVEKDIINNLGIVGNRCLKGETCYIAVYSWG